MNGISKTVDKIIFIIWRQLKNKQILYYAELNERTNDIQNLPSNVTIEGKITKSEISNEDIQILTSARGKLTIECQLDDRFQKGARLWLLKVDGILVGFIWSLGQTTLQQYFFPLTEKDVYLFDNEILELFRNRSFNSFLINQVLLELKRLGKVRVFIDTHQWNIPEQRSLSKTNFKKLGTIRKIRLFHRNIVIWS